MPMDNGHFICRKKYSDNLFGVFFGQNPLKSSFPLILVELSFLIVVSRIIRFLLKPLGQPKVISEIIGGMILGPSVLSRSNKFRAYVFPDNAEYVIQNMGLIGFMFFLFISGVKMDIFAVRKADKKHWYIALFGVMVPLCCGIVVAFAWRKSMDEELVKASSIWGITSSLAMTAFPVLYPIMKELNLLSSEIGRVALSIAVIGDVIGMNGVVIFEASKQGEGRPMAALWYLISLTVVLASIFVGARQFMIWIIQITPVGKPVDQIYVVTILMGVFVVAFVADTLGLAVCNGPLWLGLAVPDGPPLGAILVEKSETILTNILMPFTFMYVGMIADLSSMNGHWYHLQPLLYVVLTGYIMKMVSTLFAAWFWDMTIRDSLTLSLIMSLRGEMDFARKVFDEMTERSYGSCIALMYSYIKGGNMVTAEEIFSMMPEDEKDAAAFTMMIDGYIKLGEMRSAEMLFHTIPDKDMVLWKTMIHAYVNSGKMNSAEMLFYAAPEKDVELWNTLIAGYVKLGDMRSAKFLFDAMLEKNVVSWNTMIDGYVELGQMKLAKMVFDAMPKKVVACWNTLIGGYVKSGDIMLAKMLFDAMPEKNVASWNIMINAFVKLRDMRSANLLFNAMPQKDVVSWTTIINGYAMSGEMRSAKMLFDFMLEKNVVSWNIMINGYVKLKDMRSAKMLFDVMPEKNVISWTSMIAGYVKLGDMRSAKMLFDVMPEKNVVASTTMINGFRLQRHFALRFCSNLSYSPSLSRRRRYHRRRSFHTPAS